MSKGVVSVLQARISRAKWAPGQTSPQSSRVEPLVANAKEDQHDMEQQSGVWSSALSAVVWNLPQLYLESGVLHTSGSLDKCLGTPDGKMRNLPWSLSVGGPALQTWLF